MLLMLLSSNVSCSYVSRGGSGDGAACSDHIPSDQEHEVGGFGGGEVPTGKDSGKEPGKDQGQSFHGVWRRGFFRV
jgi:hypothetical protein